MKRARELTTRELMPPPRCEAQVSKQTLKWIVRLRDLSPQRLSRAQREDPMRCSFDATHEVEGRHGCRRHAAMYALEILTNEEKNNEEVKGQWRDVPGPDRPGE